MEEVKKVLTAGGGEVAEPEAQAEGGEKKGFDPAIAAKIKALPTPKAVFPLALGIHN
jgi:hypothetical protein